MWTTVDGQVLRIQGFRLRRWAEAQRRGCAGRCACGCVDRAVSALQGELGELLSRARRVGTAIGKKSARRWPVFSAMRGRRRYTIFARPLFGNQHAVVAISPEPVAAPLVAMGDAAPPVDAEPPAEEPPPDAIPIDTGDGEQREFTTPRERAYRPQKDYEKSDVVAGRKYQGTISFEWLWNNHPRALSLITKDTLKGSKAYVYILELPDGTPFYAGSIVRNTAPGNRFSEYRRSARVAELFVKNVCKKRIDDAIRVRVAEVTPATSAKAAEEIGRASCRDRV